MIGRVLIVVCLLICAGFVGKASAIRDYYWWSTSDTTIGHDPCPYPQDNGWKIPTDPIPTTILKGQRFWLGVCNMQEDGKHKYVSFVLEQTQVDKFEVTLTGYKTSDSSHVVYPSSILPLHRRNALNNVDTLCWKFDSCPEWERFEIRATEDVVGLSWAFYVSHDCTLLEWLDPYATFGDEDFGPATAVQGSPRLTELWVFPVSGSVNLEAPLFSAPPSTGVWTSQFVYTDPRGGGRPGGGVKFMTTGPGLTVNDPNSHRIRLDNSNGGQFDEYVYDASDGKYTYFRQSTQNQVPTATPWGMLALGLSLAGVAVVLIARRRIA